MRHVGALFELRIAGTVSASFSKSSSMATLSFGCPSKDLVMFKLERSLRLHKICLQRSSHRQSSIPFAESLLLRAVQRVFQVLESLAAVQIKRDARDFVPGAARVRQANPRCAARYCPIALRASAEPSSRRRARRPCRKPENGSARWADRIRRCVFARPVALGAGR